MRVACRYLRGSLGAYRDVSSDAAGSSVQGRPSGVLSVVDGEGVACEIDFDATLVTAREELSTALFEA